MKAFDTETHLITRLVPAPPVVCTSTCGSADDEGEVSLGVDAVDRLLKSGDRMVGHNVAYDFSVVVAARPDIMKRVFDAYKAGRITDTGIRQQLFDVATGVVMADDEPMRRYSLAGLVKLIFDRDISGWKGGPDAWRLRYAELEAVPLEDWPEAAIEYPKVDARETYAVWAEQEDKAGHLIFDDAFQTYADFALRLMSCRGMRVDQAAVDRAEQGQLQAKAKLAPELASAGLLAWDKRQQRYVRKDKPARERMLAVCAEKGIPPRLTKTGLKRKLKPEQAWEFPQYVAVDKAACVLVDDALLTKRGQYILADKILTTYITALRQGVDGPITTGYGLAATTRTTSSAPRAPQVGTNQQNQPSEGGIRECYIPRDGYVFLAGDFSGAELHCLAQRCLWLFGHSKLAELLNAGMDIHCYVGAYLLDTTYDDMLARYKQGDPDAKSARTDAKAANFGFGGQMGPGGFVGSQLRKGRKYTLAFATFLRETWLRALPEMPVYFDHCKRLLGPQGVVTVPMWPDGPLRKVNKLTTLCNMGFQPLAARAGKQALTAVSYACYADDTSELYGTTYSLTYVHDEIICETLDEDLDTKARVFAKLMADEFNVWVPDCPTTVEPVLMRRWSKGAQTVTDAQGRYVVWEPEGAE